MNGKAHLPVIGFVLGGVVSRVPGIPFYLLLLCFLLWLITLKNNKIFLGTITTMGLLGFYILSPPLPSSSSFLSPLIISSKVEISSQSIHMIATQDSTNEKILLNYFLKEEEKLPPATWKHGAICTAKGKKMKIDPATNPGQFDYQVFMANQGVFSTVEINSHDDLQCEGRSWISYLYEMRFLLIEKVKTSVTPDAFPWIKALVFGETDDLSESTIEWFRDFNLSHILAISGLHVGLFMGSMYLIIYRMGIGTKEQAKVFLIILLPFYTFLAGAAPSVMRAALMAFIVLFLHFLKKKVPISDIISIVAFGLLLFSPHYFSSIGFQFSFLVTFSLILSLPLLSRFSNLWVQSGIISFISQFSVLPLQLHYFYEFNPLSVIANLLLVPYFSFLIIPFMLTLVVISLLLPAYISVYLSQFVKIHDLFLTIVQTVLEPLRINWIVGELSPLFIILFLGMFICMMNAWVWERIQWAFLFGILCVMTLILFSVTPYFSSKGTITMLDVGQGDAFVIELPYRKGIVMIDAAGPPVFIGNRDQTAKQVLLPFLKSRGIGTIDGLIVSHKDVDHSGSVVALVREMNIKQLVVSPFYEVNEKDVDILRVKAEEAFLIGESKFEVLHPGNNTGNPNDNSLVLSIELGGLNWLFTGDISRKVEENLIELYPSLQVDVLKVGHHGSDTSTSEIWLEVLRPSIALISAGRNNRYGHPHEEVLERLNKDEVMVFQTNIYGAVQFEFYGQSGTFSTHLPYNANR